MGGGAWPFLVGAGTCRDIGGEVGGTRRIDQPHTRYGEGHEGGPGAQWHRWTRIGVQQGQRKQLQGSARIENVGQREEGIQDVER